MAETGHATNLNNFSTLVTVATTMGPRYNPKAANIKLPALNTLKSSASSAISLLGENKTTLKNTQNTRKATFEGLDTHTRRIQASAKSAGATPDQLADIEAIARKIKGERAGTKNPDPVNPGDPQSVSVSQQSYVNLASHFKGLITLLGSISAYDPDETDLTVASLQDLQQQMVTANANITNAEIAYSSSKNTRDTVLYGETSGLVDIAATVKDYIFSTSHSAIQAPTTSS